MDKKLEIPQLAYETNALEPYISEKTLSFHYGKHHQAYLNNLKGLIPGTPFENETLESMVFKAEGPIFNNAAQVWNHTFYFTSFSPNGKGTPSGKFLEAIIKYFGSFEGFKEKFATASVTLFGSGWAWLVQKEDGSLDIIQEQNAGNPMRKGFTPLLTCDVWEHAYYLDYQNRRPDYIDNFWKIVDWDIVSSRLKT